MTTMLSLQRPSDPGILPPESYPENDRGITIGLTVAEKARNKYPTMNGSLTTEYYSDNAIVTEAPVMTTHQAT